MVKLVLPFAGALLLCPTVALAQTGEARDVTTVSVSAVKWDIKTSEEGGCGTDGCRPELLYDDSFERESRWSCRQPDEPDFDCECAAIFTFDEPQNMAGIKIAFMNGDTRQRTVGISYETEADADGNTGHVRVGDFTSSGQTDQFEEILVADFPLLETEKVIEVAIFAASSTPYNQWLSITEVSLEVYDVVCEEQYSEARDLTGVLVTAVKWDRKTSEEGGCGTDGCRPALVYDDSLEAESRWSCQQPIDPDTQEECAVVFIFDEPQDMSGVKIAFLKGDERQRTVGISYESIHDFNGQLGHVNVGRYTSSGLTDQFEEIPLADFPLLETTGVVEVAIFNLASAPFNQWLSLTEISLEVVSSSC